jgi:hypothetical protein
MDYLMPDVRIHIGDIDGKRFSNSLVRTALVNSIYFLDKRWGDRYTVVQSGTYLPSGVRYREYAFYPHEVREDTLVRFLIPSGFGFVRFSQGYAVCPLFNVYFVLRNPYVLTNDVYDPIIEPGDVYPVILVASNLLLRTWLTSNADSLVSWSDGEFSYSAIQASKTILEMIKANEDSLKDYFRQRLADSILIE